MFNSKDVEREYEYSYRQVQDIEDYKHPLINFSDVIKAHYFLADYFLDISSDSIEKMSVGVKSYHLLGSALSRQIVSYQGRMKYSNPIDICSTLFYGLVTDHPFVDGNKRTALLVLLYQLQLYGYYPNTEINKFEKLVISVAERSIQQKYRMIYKKFKKETDVDAEVLTISYIIKRLTDKVDRSFHLNLTTKEFCDTLAMGLFNIQAAVDPEKIAIGGGISQQPILHEYIQKSLDEIYEKMPIPIPRVQIVPCAYFNDSNLIGALANYKKTFNIE